MKFILGSILLFFSIFAEAKLQIPTQMNKAERVTLLEILGPSSAMKILSDPYPLGGYQGIEFGISNEILATEEVSRLGDRPTKHGETSYSLLSLGKGVYNNFDFFVQFSPLGQAEEISNYGGQLRWGFYQAEYLPTHLSLILGANSVNYQEKVTVASRSVDIVNGYVIDDLAFYVGIGNIVSDGSFIGGAGGVTDDQISHQESVTSSHYLVGLNLKFSKAFLALQLDRATQATYSFKLGARF